jgi:hypothetical protein
MIVYKNIEQGSVEWHALRYGKIGGTSLKNLMTNEGKPVEYNAIFNEILASRMEDFEYAEGVTSKDMQRGHDLEPMARMRYEFEKGVDVIQVGFIEYNDFCGFSPDGLIGSSKALEIKCPNANTHTSYILNPMAMISDYVWQCVMYFLVLEDLESLDFVSYRPENNITPILIQTINRDTIVAVGVKKTAKIADLVGQAQARLLELELSIKQQLKLLTNGKDSSDIGCGKNEVAN